MESLIDSSDLQDQQDEWDTKPGRPPSHKSPKELYVELASKPNRSPGDYESMGRLLREMDEDSRLSLLM